MTQSYKSTVDAKFAELIRERINACLSENTPLKVLPLEDDLLRAFPEFRDRRIIRDRITAAAIGRGVPLILEQVDVHR
ncbi:MULTISPECIES: hypothetical protein [unclassified Chelatococcus]|uniref:hypothetical protein n=1 Tax=unclassified Chelatococcus TaxID=2638111 RepID=UPI001BD18D0E|nr:MULTISPECIES: hypothetical protein [unclassified Chelatococcus]CAH1653909.1 hypothetical protein CHELA20_11030 [Hyphomicrobiales bacterium]MBS7742847.1 hypothetical protein [Chelatococcus sp. HY11]MBX3542035.1 hypothetical protein [Chelatococcus sp.]MCO5074073.1 hypothetical protein [Chelatococcus sp.]CAH1694685.1 hypothetical protein CHELA41_51261 [Hyphomicrobiales bacterium]